MSAEIRKLRAEVRELKTQLSNQTRFIAIALNQINETSKAHNSLQGFLIASGVLSTDMFAKPEIELNRAQVPGISYAVDEHGQSEPLLD